MQFLRILFFILAMGWSGVDAVATVPVPPLRSQVTDLTAMLTSDQARQLTDMLRAFETRKGAQLAVLLVPTTQPDTIEQYGLRVAEQWKLGRQGVDDGALLLVAKDDRALRIEVGYGLEGVLPDAIAKRIISEVITPLFKKGDFHGGIDAGLRRMIQVIDGEPLPPPAARPGGMRGGTQGLFNLLPFAIFALPALGGLLRMVFGRLPAAAVGSLLAAAVLWFIAVPLVVIVIVALFIFIVLLLAGGGSGISPSRGHSGGWSSGGSFGGGSGGGFSGGGGSFGGGGASGRW